MSIPERDAITKPAIDTVTSPKDDMQHTMKYPSDGDEDTVSVPL